MYDLYAPIVPYVGMGGFSLNMSKESAERVLGYPLKNGELMHNGAWEKYKIDNVLTLYFSTVQNQLKVISTEKNYKGLLMDKISTSTDEVDLLTLDPTLIYDEFEEVYESKVNGYQLVTNLPDEKAEWISIYASDWDESRQLNK